MTRIIVVEPDGAGGMIHYAHQMCTALAAAGGDVTLITRTSYELASLPHTYEVLPMMRLWTQTASGRSYRPSLRLVAAIGRKLRRVWRGISFARAWSQMTEWILAERPDVAQFGAIRFPFQGYYLRKLRRAGIALTQVCHEFEPREAGRLRRWVNRRSSIGIYRSFDVIFLHAQENADRFLDYFPVDPAVIRIIPHGNEAMFLEAADSGGDLRDRYGIPADRRVVLFFGGLRPSKGVPDLVAAFALLAPECDAHLVVAGPAVGVDPEELLRQADRLGVGDRVAVDDRYLPISEIGPLMRTATVVALPYRTATASGVLQVAYAFARPVVATATGAFSTDVVHGATGFLVPPADPEAMAVALLKILSNPAESEEMGRRAREAALADFAWEPIADAILDAYREIDR